VRHGLCSFRRFKPAFYVRAGAFFNFREEEDALFDLAARRSTPEVNDAAGASKRFVASEGVRRWRTRRGRAGRAGPSSAAIRSARPISGLVVGVLMAAWAAGL